MYMNRTEVFFVWLIHFFLQYKKISYCIAWIQLGAINWTNGMNRFVHLYVIWIKTREKITSLTTRDIRHRVKSKSISRHKYLWDRLADLIFVSFWVFSLTKDLNLRTSLLRTVAVTHQRATAYSFVPFVWWVFHSEFYAKRWLVDIHIQQKFIPFLSAFLRVNFCAISWFYHFQTYRRLFAASF